MTERGLLSAITVGKSFTLNGNFKVHMRITLEKNLTHVISVERVSDIK